MKVQLQQIDFCTWPLYGMHFGGTYLIPTFNALKNQCNFLVFIAKVLRMISKGELVSCEREYKVFGDCW